MVVVITEEQVAMKEAVFTVKLEAELRDAFLAEAAATHLPASQLVREFMLDFVKRQREAREHDAWFREQVEQSVREADDPGVRRISNDDVRSKWQQQRADLLKRAGS
jgi:hypothetical protein